MHALSACPVCVPHLPQRSVRHAPGEYRPAHVHADETRAGVQALAQRVRARVRRRVRRAAAARLRLVVVVLSLSARRLVSVLALLHAPLRLCGGAAAAQAAEEPHGQHEQRNHEILRLLADEPQHKVGHRMCAVRQVPPVVHVLAQQQLPLAGRRVDPVLGHLALVGDLEGAREEEVDGQCHCD